MLATTEELKSKTVAELQKIAADRGVSRTKGVKKADLIAAIVDRGSSNGAAKTRPAKPSGERAEKTAERSAEPKRSDRQDEGGQRGRSHDEQRGDRAAQQDRGGQDRRNDYRNDQRERRGGGGGGGNNRDQQRRERRRNRKKGRGGGGGGGGGGRLPQVGDREWSSEELKAEGAELLTGILEVMPDGYGFVRIGSYLQTGRDGYVPQQIIRRMGLRRGDEVAAWVRFAREGEKYNAVLKIEQIGGQDTDMARRRPDFKDLTPLFPTERFRLEWGPRAITERVVDLIAPQGKGQRALIVSPPKAGKTTVLKQIANGIAANDPSAHIIVLLVDERPEEVTDWQRTVKANEVVFSTFDRPADDHTQVSELVLARAQRLVEQGRDVVILLDSITRLARAYNLAAPASGRILSGGVDSGALYPPKRFFGAARNIEEGGSLTIIASALIETGSKMDEVIFEEFKGTGNSEIRLDRSLAEKRIYPAINIEASSTRKEELLYSQEELPLVWRWRRLLSALEPRQGMELLRDKMMSTENNAQLLIEISKMKNVD
ncbi:MAG: transcription termination factor Rho [Actinomycetota bacterium]